MRAGSHTSCPTGTFREVHVKSEESYRRRLPLTQRRNLKREFLDIENSACVNFGSTLSMQFMHVRSTVEEAEALAAVERKLRDWAQAWPLFASKSESAPRPSVVHGCASKVDGQGVRTSRK
jgi:hypothetical protein